MEEGEEVRAASPGHRPGCSEARSGSDALFRRTQRPERAAKAPSAPLSRGSLPSSNALVLPPAGKPMKSVLAVALLVMFQVRSLALSEPRPRAAPPTSRVLAEQRGICWKETGPSGG